MSTIWLFSYHMFALCGSVVAERLRAPNSNSFVPISRVWVRNPSHDTCVKLSKTLQQCFVLWMGRKAVGPICCVTNVKWPSALIEKWRGSPGVPGCGCRIRRSTLSIKVLEFITAMTYLSESLYKPSALSTLFDRYVRYIRRRYYEICMNKKAYVEYVRAQTISRLMVN